jgi:hypothetical protein
VRDWGKETVSAWVWGAVLPVLMVLRACFVHPAGLLLGCTYPLQIWRLRRLPGGLQRAVFLVLGKFPEAMGVLQFAWDRLWRSHGRLIEYK